LADRKFKSNLNPMQNDLSYALASAHRKVTASLNACVKKHGVQVEAWRVIEVLESGQRLTMRELAEAVLMNPPTLTKLIDRMVSKGLVHRQISRQDSRQIYVLPTELGRKKMMQVRQDVEDQNAVLLRDFGPGEAEKMIQLLNGLSDQSAL